MTAKDIISEWCKDCMRERSSTLVFPNVFVDLFEADIMEITKAGYAHELEVKISRADFMADVKKEQHTWVKNADWTKRKRITINKHEHMRAGERVNTFTYIVPEGLVREDEVPQKAGLIYVTVNEYRGKTRFSFKVIRKAGNLSKTKHGERIKEKCLLSTYYRYHNSRK